MDLMEKNMIERWYIFLCEYFWNWKYAPSTVLQDKKHKTYYNINTPQEIQILCSKNVDKYRARTNSLCLFTIRKVGQFPPKKFLNIQLDVSDPFLNDLLLNRIPTKYIYPVCIYWTAENIIIAWSTVFYKYYVELLIHCDLNFCVSVQKRLI